MDGFLLFFGDWYYPAGGWRDFKGAFATVEEAAAAGMAAVRADPNSERWWHVLDVAAGRIVLHYQQQKTQDGSPDDEADHG